MEWSRREFLSQMGAAGVASMVPGAIGACASREPICILREPNFGISLAQWSLHRRFFDDKKDAMEFPAMARREFGIDAVEYVNAFYKDRVTTPGTFSELRKRCDDEGVTSVLIMCDGEGAIGAREERERLKTVDNHRKWLDAAKSLGCHAIRVNAASEGTYEEQTALAADGLTKLCDAADPLGLSVIVENHGGLSSNGQWLAGVMKKCGHRRVGTLPDFGNFRVSKDQQYDRYLGTQELMPFAKAVSAKSYDFDAAGNETKLDYPRLMKIVLDAGYRGRVGIEYEGDRLSEPDGIRATKALLERIRGA